jgi:hypothetical protein
MVCDREKWCVTGDDSNIIIIIIIILINKS